MAHLEHACRRGAEPHKRPPAGGSKACLYITRLTGVDRAVLRESLERCLAAV